MTTWKTVPVEVSDDGQVRVYGKTMTPTGSPRGYQCTRLSIHRLIARAFIGAPPEDGQCWVVHHVDGNPRNNELVNLRWLTESDNKSRPYRCQRRSLSIQQVEEIKALRPPQQTASLGELATAFGVSYGAVTSVRARTTHVNGYSSLPQTKLTATQVEAILAWRPPTPSAPTVARQFKVSTSTVRDIWNKLR